MVEGIESLPAKLELLPLSDGKRLEHAQIEVIRPAGLECVATDGGSVGKAPAFYPANLARVDTNSSVGIAKAGSAVLRAERRRKHRAAVQGGTWVADVWTVGPGYCVVISIKPIPNGKRGSRLKRCDACDCPAAEHVFPRPSA